jgi:hypothetical protein
MEFAINKGAANALLTGVSWVFHTHTFAGAVDGNVATQDLTPSSCAFAGAMDGNVATQDLTPSSC